MSIKAKITSLITIFILLCSLLTVGVFAIKQTDFQVTGDIVFKATGVKSTIENTGFNGNLTNGTVGVDKLTAIEIDDNMNATQIAEELEPWKNLSMTFGSDGADVTLKLRITNNAESGANNYIYSEITVDEGTSSNCTVKAVNDADNTSLAVIAPQEYADFTITFSVIDKKVDASLIGFAINFNLQFKKLEDFSTSEDYTDVLTFTCDESAQTASVAAANTNITSAEIPSVVLSENGVICKVTEISDEAFKSCKSLKSITIPLSVTSIRDNAFYGCSGLTSITIPSSVTSIGIYTFYSCSGLTSITIPDSVTSIEYGAFAFCYDLTSITISDSVTSIGDWAFSECTSLTSIAIPDSVTSIGEGAFFDCVDLSSIAIPDSVTSIGETAFASCGFTSVTIPAGVTSIGVAAFGACNNLTSIVVESGNSVYDSRENCNAIIETETYTLIQGCGNTIIPDSITSIGDGAFAGSGLTSIEIPDSVTSIGDWAFYECASLTSITIPDGVTSIGDWAFYECASLTSITIPDGVTSIGESAFSSCENLTSVTIGNGVESIGDDAFGDCSSLESITIPDSVTSIGEHAFDSCSALTSITIGNGVESIGDNAFAFCESLTTVYYRGNEYLWTEISIGVGNEWLHRAEIMYNYFL